MSTPAGDNLNHLVDQASEAIQSAVKCGLDMQQASARWMIDTWSNPESLQAWQRQGQALLGAALEASRSNVDAMSRLARDNTRMGLQLWERIWTAARHGASAGGNGGTSGKNGG